MVPLSCVRGSSSSRPAFILAGSLMVNAFWAARMCWLKRLGDVLAGPRNPQQRGMKAGGETASEHTESL